MKTKPGWQEIGTPVGPARAEIRPAPRAQRVLVLGHGAGGGTSARDLAALAQALPSHGTTVVLVEQPWRVAGRKVAVPPSRLDLAWTAVLSALRAGGALDHPLVVGGRSAGARVACRTARAVGAVAVLALSFPLHPPGRPERSRLPELAGAGVPTLVVQGDRDPFGGPGEFPPGTALLAVPNADHGFRVSAKATPGQAAVLALIVDSVTAWLDTLAP